MSILISSNRNTIIGTEATTTAANSFSVFYQIFLDFSTGQTGELNMEVMGIFIPTSQTYQFDLNFH